MTFQCYPNFHQYPDIHQQMYTQAPAAHFGPSQFGYATAPTLPQDMQHGTIPQPVMPPSNPYAGRRTNPPNGQGGNIRPNRSSASSNNAWPQPGRPNGHSRSAPTRTGTLPPGAQPIRFTSVNEPNRERLVLQPKSNPARTPTSNVSPTPGAIDKMMIAAERRLGDLCHKCDGLYAQIQDLSAANLGNNTERSKSETSMIQSLCTIQTKMDEICEEQGAVKRDVQTTREVCQTTQKAVQDLQEEIHIFGPELRSIPGEVQAIGKNVQTAHEASHLAQDALQALLGEMQVLEPGFQNLPAEVQATRKDVQTTQDALQNFRGEMQIFGSELRSLAIKVQMFGTEVRGLAAEASRSPKIMATPAPETLTSMKPTRVHLGDQSKTPKHAREGSEILVQGPKAKGSKIGRVAKRGSNVGVSGRVSGRRLRSSGRA